MIQYSSTVFSTEYSSHRRRESPVRRGTNERKIQNVWVSARDLITLKSYSSLPAQLCAAMCPIPKDEVLLFAIKKVKLLYCLVNSLPQLNAACCIETGSLQAFTRRFCALTVTCSSSCVNLSFPNIAAVRSNDSRARS